MQVVRLGFSWGLGLDVLIRMNTRVLGGQSGGVLLFGQLGPFHFSLKLNVFIYSFLYFVMHLDFH